MKSIRNHILASVAQKLIILLDLHAKNNITSDLEFEIDKGIFLPVSEQIDEMINSIGNSLKK